MSLLAGAKVSALHALTRAEHYLARGEAAGLMAARLVPDMLPFSEQIGITASVARRATLGLVDPAFSPALDWTPATLPDLLARVRAEVEAAQGPVLEVIVHRAGQADLRQDPQAYLYAFALPNLWFHLAAAHAILRANGVPVGKGDFDGLHRWDAPIA